MALSQALHYWSRISFELKNCPHFLTSSLVAGVKPVARPLGSCLFLKMAPVRIQACYYLHWGSIQSIPNYLNSLFHRSGILLFNSKDCSCPESEDFMTILLVGTQILGLGWMDMDYHITVSCQVQDRIQELWLQALSFQYSLGIWGFESWTSFHEAETERLPPGPVCVFMYSSESFILMTIFCSSTSSCPAWIRSSIVCCQWNKQTAENEQLPTCPEHDQTAHDWYFALQNHEKRDFSWKNLTLGGMKGRRGSSFGLRINFGPIFSAPPFSFTHYNHTLKTDRSCEVLWTLSTKRVYSSAIHRL